MFSTDNEVDAAITRWVHAYHAVEARLSTFDGDNGQPSLDDSSDPVSDLRELFDQREQARSEVYRLRPGSMRNASALLKIVMTFEENALDDPELRTLMSAILVAMERVADGRPTT